MDEEKILAKVGALRQTSWNGGNVLPIASLKSIRGTCRQKDLEANPTIRRHSSAIPPCIGKPTPQNHPPTDQNILESILV